MNIFGGHYSVYSAPEIRFRLHCEIGGFHSIDVWGCRPPGLCRRAGYWPLNMWMAHYANRWESVTQLSEQPSSAECFTRQCFCGGRYKTGNVYLINPGQCNDSSFTWHAHQQSVAEPKLHLDVLLYTTPERRDVCTWDCQKYPLYHHPELYWHSCQKNFTNNLLVALVVLTLLALKVSFLLVCDVLQCNRWRHRMCAKLSCKDTNIEDRASWMDTQMNLTEAGHEVPTTSSMERIVSQLIKKFPICMEPNAPLTRSQELAITRLIQSRPSQPISLRYILTISSHLRVDLPGGLVSVVHRNPVYPVNPVHFSPLRATCRSHLILLDLITRIIFGEEYR